MLRLFGFGRMRLGPYRNKPYLWLIAMPLLILAGTAAVFCYRVHKQRRTSSGKADPLLLLRGSGERLWAAEHADDYVRRLREGFGISGISR